MQARSPHIERALEYDDAGRMRAVKHDGAVAMSYPHSVDPSSTWLERYLGLVTVYDSEHFSLDDKNYARENKINVYLLTPRGNFMTWYFEQNDYAHGGRI